MAVRYRTSDGYWSVEVVRLTGTPNNHDGEWIRVRNLGFFVADVRSVVELESYVSLAELEDSLTGLRLSESYSNQHFSPPGNCSRTSQKIHRWVTGCRWATSRRCQPSTATGRQVLSA